MDERFDPRKQLRENSFGSISGRITELVPFGMRREGMDTCMLMASVESKQQGINNFIITPNTYTVDFIELKAGMECTFWYRLDVPVPLIYPPQYHAVVAAENRDDRRVEVSRFNEMLINEAGNLQLNLDKKVPVRTANNQVYPGSPANHELVVVYDMTTRSIPAQTTPLKVVVLCENDRQQS